MRWSRIGNLWKSGFPESFNSLIIAEMDEPQTMRNTSWCFRSPSTYLISDAGTSLKQLIASGSSSRTTTVLSVGLRDDRNMIRSSKSLIPALTVPGSSPVCLAMSMAM